MTLENVIAKLYTKNNLDYKELLFLINNINKEENKEFKNLLFNKAYDTRVKNYGNTVFFRGLIEISSYCKCNCLYCGLRCQNKLAERYRLTKSEILSCCKEGYDLGFRTFVLQGGEDPYYTDDILCDIISSIKKEFHNCAITLSLGERSKESYKKLFQAGADRYLLRHETATKSIYDSLHPNMSFENRIRALYDLKEIGFQTGAGFLVGVPGSSNDSYARDLILLKDLNPEMVGIGPFIPQKNTPLATAPRGDVDTVLLMLAITRLLLPHVLLPATTALGTLDPDGREKGFKVGANIIMPNLSPLENRAKYALYDGKVFTNDEAAESLNKIKLKIKQAGFMPDMSKGDNILWKRK